MKKLYYFNTTRNKLPKGRLSQTIKNHLISQKGRICYICRKEILSEKELELEHKTPVEVGGHLFDEKNVELCCITCHLKKTETDKKVIRILKEIKVIFLVERGGIYSFFPIQKIQEFYYLFFNLYKESLENFEKVYLNGKNKIDYEYFHQSINREEIYTGNGGEDTI